jgi:SulP family sulfate permease
MSGLKQKISAFIPALNWLPQYKKSNLSGDLSAGLTVGVMLVPQGMAYAMLAGLPPIYGLYASIVPLIIYALFGTSRQLAVGPVAMVALLIASGVGALTTDPALYIQYAILLALLVGAIQLLMGLLRLGFLVNFLSHPVIAGFTSAAAIIIGLSQLKHMLGLDIPRGKVHSTLTHVFQHADEIHWLTAGIGVAAIMLIVGMRKLSRKIPAPLIIVILGVVLVSALGLVEEGVGIVGAVPSGLPKPGLPIIDFASIQELLPIALAISLIGFMESIAVAKAIQAKHKDYEVVPNQELIGLGLANIAGAFFRAFPTTGGFSRTAVNDQAGAKTGLASIISAALVLITLLFLTEYFYYLPKAILAAIIMVAVFGLIDFKEARHLWKTDRRDFAMFMVTAMATLALGVEEGIAVGVILSLAMVIFRVSYPHAARLGRLRGTDLFRNVNRFENAQEIPGVLIVRIDAPLFFANLNHINEKLKEFGSDSEQVKNIILDASAIHSVDSSATHALVELSEKHKAAGRQLSFANIRGPVRDVMEQAGLVAKIGADHFYTDVLEAVNHMTNGANRIDEDVTLQSNI